MNKPAPATSQVARYEALIGPEGSHLEDMIDASPSCLKIISDNGTLLWMNPSGLAMIEADDLESVLGASVYDLVAPEHLDAFKTMNRSVCQGNQEELCFDIIALRGTRRVMETYAAPYLLTDGTTAHVAITNDVSERVLAEELLLRQRVALESSARLASLGQLSAGIAHEINNPLAIIAGKTGLIRRRIEKGTTDLDSIAEDLLHIEDTVTRISSIVNGLRAFSRDSSDEPKMMINLASLFEDTISLCREQFATRGVKLVVDVDPGVELCCNSGQLSHVLMNLINNASEAVEQVDDRWIRLEAVALDSRIRMRIRDSGAGIKPSVADRMMEPFFTTKEVGDGTGLGLPVAAGIVQAHGGRLYCDTENAHTTFVIDLPQN